MTLSNSRRCYASVIDRAVLFATLLGAGVSCPAAAQKADAREEVIIQANRHVADEQVTLQVQQALTDDPWIFADHITITTQNGVVTLEGVVADSQELLRILRLCRRIPGARQVNTGGVEINAQLPDSG